MPALLHRNDFKSPKTLEFCYLCGNPFSDDLPNHPDHIPPQAMFAEEDRDFPLKVAAHQTCNNINNRSDELISQLVALRRNQVPRNDGLGRRVDIVGIGTSNTPSVVTNRINVHKEIGRWLRGFHTALYGQFLPNETPNQIMPPLPVAVQVNGIYVIDPIPDAIKMTIASIKQNRAAENNLDRIVCRNGNLTYECVWHLIENAWHCLFALRIYDWEMLGDRHNFKPRGCAGYYKPVNGVPPNATRYTALDRTPFRNQSPLDPFND